MTESASTKRPLFGAPPVVAVIAFAVVACSIDDGQANNREDTDASIPEDTISTEPRDPDELPGVDTDPGDDPCDEDPSCHWEARGVGTDRPFEDDAISSARLDAEGAVTLDDTIEEDYVIWIPNTAAGTISRVDSRARAEVGRYRTGPSSQSLAPSATTVDTRGAVYVANRDGLSVTKIALYPECPASGEPITSTGPDEVLSWGDDDCQLWSTELSGHGPLRAISSHETEDGNYLWVGAREHSIWKLDAETGTVLFRTESPVSPDGFVLDDEQNLWISTFYEQEIGRIDTARCRDHGSCEVDVCDGHDPECIKERIEAPAMVKGITIDGDRRICTGGDLLRFDPQAPAGQRWLHVDPNTSIVAVASDGENWIFGAGGENGLFRFLADNPEQSAAISGTSNRSVTAVDIDHHGYLWGINRDHNDAFVVEPGAGLFDGQLDDQVAGFDEPDADSDMTGSVVRFPLEQLGALRQIFEQCDPNETFHTEWQTLRFDAEVQGNSRLEWRVRAATSRGQLESAQWIDVVTVPPASSPLDLRAVLAQEQMARAAFIELEVRLRPGMEDGEFYVPRLVTMDVIAHCPEIIL